MTRLLNGVAGSTEPATPPAAFNLGLTSSVRRELKASAHSLTPVVAMIIIALPIAFGLVRRNAYALQDGLDFYALMLSDLVPLTFPLLVVALSLPRISDEFSHNFLTPVRSRIPARAYLTSKLVSVAIVAFVVFFGMAFCAWLFAFGIEPLIGFNNYRQVAISGPGISPPTDASLYTYTQLLTVSSTLYGLVYSGWVGLNASAYAILGVLSLMMIDNRFIALSLPFVIYQVANFAMAVLGLEGFGSVTSIFPFGLVQQPVWHSFVPLAVLLASCGALWWFSIERDFDTPGLK